MFKNDNYEFNNIMGTYPDFADKSGWAPNYDGVIRLALKLLNLTEEYNKIENFKIKYPSHSQMEFYKKFDKDKIKLIKKQQKEKNKIIIDLAKKVKKSMNRYKKQKQSRNYYLCLFLYRNLKSKKI